jgi:LmbE family N-acetylglucosaminyl deacetylase
MLPTLLRPPGRRPLQVLCLGAHSDDIEIGCGGTLLALAEAGIRLRVRWVVLNATGARATEARRGAGRFLGRAVDVDLSLAGFRDGFFPFQGAEVKEYLEDHRRTGPQPDVVFTHYRHDRHQDHRLVSDLTWNTYRDHLILEYEIPKWDGDLGVPNAFVPLTAALGRRKIRHLNAVFATQRSKRWFTDDTFMSLMRLRGIECAAPGGLAEAFYLRKQRLL